MKLIICLFLLANLNIFAEDNHHDHSHHHDEQKKTKKSLSAHEHGLSVLNIVQDMNTISFEFEMPGFDVVGFEYKAKKKEDIKKIKNALNILSDYQNMVSMSSEAKCDQEKNSAKVLNEGSHSEFLSEYVFYCKNIDLLKSIKIIYFDSFKLSKKLNINIIADNKKLSKTFERDANKINVEGFFN